MTDEQINERIARLCGWTPYPPITNDGWPSLMVPPNSPKKEGWVEDIPNYAADLNACHEFEETMLKKADDRGYSNTFHQYGVLLHKAALGRQMHPCYYAIHATARQRCEAFLRVHNQWEEEA